MFWDAFDTTAASHPQFRDLFTAVRKAIEQAGHNPVLDPHALARVANIDRNAAEFVVAKLVENRFLYAIESFRCPACGLPVAEEDLHETGPDGELQCRCGERFIEPRKEVRYMLTEPGEYQPAEALAVRARIGLVTALPKEAAAVRAMLDSKGVIHRRTGNRVRTYDIGTVPALGGTHVVIHLLIGDMGNNAAANRATALREQFPQIEHIIMVGIAGGVPNPRSAEKHVRLGDVVVSDRQGVIQFDYVKLEPDRTEERYRPVPPAAQLIEAVNRIRTAEAEGSREWVSNLKRGANLPGSSRPDDSTDILLGSLSHPIDAARHSGEPRVFYGPIASSNALLKDAKVRDRLGEEYSVKAVEMEGSGIADATWESGTGYLVIRGICDYCDTAKNDVWQEYASLAAAAYLRALLMNLPDLA